MNDGEQMITPLQSTTIRTLIIGMVIQIITVIGIITGKVFDVHLINTLVDSGYTVLVNGIVVILQWKAIQGRIKATEIIGGNYAEKLRNTK